MKLRRLQLSLGTLLLLLTVFALALSHVFTTRQLVDARKELKDYRSQYGHLVIDDPSRPHVLRYANVANPWKWHINFPEGQNYKMICGVGNVPMTGVPVSSDLHHVKETWIVGTGENRTMFVSLLESDSESSKFTIGCEESQTINQIVKTADLYTESAFSFFAEGHGDTFSAAPDESFVIFYQTECGTELPNTKGRGVVVWIEPVK